MLIRHGSADFRNNTPEIIRSSLAKSGICNSPEDRHLLVPYNEHSFLRNSGMIARSGRDVTPPDPALEAVKMPALLPAPRTLADVGGGILVPVGQSMLAVSSRYRIPQTIPHSTG